MQINELNKGTLFTFTGDSKQYVFGGCDGRYAKVFESLKDYKKFKNVAYVDCSTHIREVQTHD